MSAAIKDVKPEGYVLLDELMKTELVDYKDKTQDPYGATFHEVANLKKSGMDVQNQLDYLYEHLLEGEIWENREDEASRDLGIRLFARQKKQSVGVICLAFWAVEFIYIVQLVVLYNLGRFNSKMGADRMVAYVERLMFSNYLVLHDPHAPSDALYSTIVATFNGSTINFMNLYDKGYCLTNAGTYEAAFNVVAGLWLVYLFIFHDIFDIVFYMPLTRSFPGKEAKAPLMLLGTMLLVMTSAAIYVWLGVIAGQTVNANVGSFVDVLQSALSVFIVLQIDDQVLPFIRWFIEERGQLDEWGDLKIEQLRLLYHGAQYHRPGYGHNWITKMRNPNLVLRLLPIPLLLFSMSLVAVPLSVSIAQAAQALKHCPDGNPLVPVTALW